MTLRLLLVEDDPQLVRALTDLFVNQGHSLSVASDGAVALELAEKEVFDLIILDWLLPSISGLEICRELRLAGDVTPILLLTARDQIKDKILGFKTGADDYLTKPFEMDELQIRIEALLRRSARHRDATAPIYKFGGVVADFSSLQVTREQCTIALSERECRLLHYFVEHRGEVLSRELLLEKVWGYNTAPYTRTVDVHILRLRQKIERDPKNPRFIVTIHGLGYRFDG